MKINLEYLGWNIRALSDRKTRWLCEGRTIFDITISDIKQLALNLKGEIAYSFSPLKSSTVDDGDSELWSFQALMNFEHEEAENGDGALALLTRLTQQ